MKSLRLLLILGLLPVCAYSDSGQAAGPAMLNSERIEARYGSYGVTVLQQAGNRRLSCLYSNSGGNRTCRTIAIVMFEATVPAVLDGPLERIRAGASLGATLAADDWTIAKRHLHIGDYPVPADRRSAVAAHFRIDPPVTLGLHVYRLSARREDRDIPVATVLEIHHPDYLDATRLRRIYQTDTAITLPPPDLGVWFERLGDVPPPSRFN
jgi:hypothetical protein